MQEIQSIKAAKLQDTLPEDPLSDYIERHGEKDKMLKLCAFPPMPHCEKLQNLCAAGYKPTVWITALNPRHLDTTRKHRSLACSEGVEARLQLGCRVQGLGCRNTLPAGIPE